MATPASKKDSMTKPTTSKTGKKTKNTKVGALPVPAMAIGGVLLLVVLVIVGVVLMSTPDSKPIPPPILTPSAKNQAGAPFMDTLMANPVQGIILAYTKYTMPAVAITVVVFAVLVAIIVGVVLYVQHQNKLKEDALKLAEEQKRLNNDPVKLLMAEPDSFFKRPKYAVGFIVSILGVLAVIGLIVWIAVNSKKGGKGAGGGGKGADGVKGKGANPDPKAAADQALQDKVNLILKRYSDYMAKISPPLLLDPVNIFSHVQTAKCTRPANFITSPPTTCFYGISTDHTLRKHNEALKTIRVLMMVEADMDKDLDENAEAVFVDMNKDRLFKWAKASSDNANSLDDILQFAAALSCNQY